MTTDPAFEIRVRAALRDVLDAQSGPHPSWDGSPAAARAAEPRSHGRLRRWPRNGLLAAAVLGVSGVVIAGALRLQAPEPSPDLATNGWIAFAANGDAGDDLLGTDVGRNGDGDLYLARDGQPPRRVMGDDRDQASVMCAAFSRDGDSLAVVELDLGSVTPTPPPVQADDDVADSDVDPPGTDADIESPPEPGPLAWRIVVAAIDEAGGVASLARLEASPDLSSCAKWSPDGRRLAYLTTNQDDRQQLWVVSLDGPTSALSVPVALGDMTNYASQAAAFDWAPDGATIALLGDDGLSLLSLVGGDPRQHPARGFRSVLWSPDGTQLALGRASLIRVIARDGTVVADVAVNMERGEGPPPFAWSPDGRALAYAEGDAIVTVSPEGAELQRVPLDVGAILGEPLTSYPPFVLAWSPDGRSVLIGAGGVDRWGSIIAVRMGGDRGATLIAGPTYALRAGVSASWQAVREQAQDTDPGGER